MKIEEYEVLFNLEGSYWWYVGLRKLVLSFIDDINNKRKELKILDAGCGTGKLLDELRTHKVYGIDFSEEAIRYCKLRNLDNVVRGSICFIPFKNCFFDIVVSLDVLYHKNVLNDVETLKEIYRVMNKNGVLLLNLPAYNFLKSRHDEAVHTRYRYTVKDLKEKVEKSGFVIEKITYRNIFLFPLAITKRIMEKYFMVNNKNVESDLKPTPYLINYLFTHLLYLENKLIRLGTKFPFGLSIYCIAKKK